MKREILFRGKDIGGKDWFYGSYLRTDDNTNDCFGGKNINIRHQIVQYEAGDWNLGGWAYYDVIPETIGQFTGLTDKKCGKIFSGDILQWVSCNPFSLGETRRVVVNYINGWYFCVGSISVSLAELLAAERCEIIGNIHDNPELLKQWNS